MAHRLNDITKLRFYATAYFDISALDRVTKHFFIILVVILITQIHRSVEFLRKNIISWVEPSIQYISLASSGPVVLLQRQKIGKNSISSIILVFFRTFSNILRQCRLGDSIDFYSGATNKKLIIESIISLSKNILRVPNPFK